MPSLPDLLPAHLVAAWAAWLQARNVKDMAEEIEEQRAKIEARTPITEEVGARGLGF